jgi:hypothetical protein
MGPSRRSVVVILALSAAGGSAGADLPSASVLTSRAWEWRPAAGADAVASYVSWTEDSVTRRNHVDEFVRVAGGQAVRVNAPGTKGYGGGMDGARLVFQQADRDSNLRMYDASTRTYSALPAGLNNGYWQWSPTYDDPWILYGENRFERGRSPWKVFLFNIETGERRFLDQVTYHCACIMPGQVQGNYATWFACHATCGAYLYDIAARQTTRVPNPAGKVQYYPAVDAAGTVYIVQSAPACGKAVRLVRYPLGSTQPATLLALGKNKDVDETLSTMDAGGSTDLYFSRFACTRHGQGDVYVLHGADGPVPTSRTAPSALRPVPSAGSTAPHASTIGSKVTLVGAAP